MEYGRTSSLCIYLDDGGQCKLRKSDRGGLGVEIFQYEVIELLDQAILE